jgi:hypothetical protein
MRYIAGLLPTMKIAWGAREFEIVSVLDVREMRRELVLMCTEDV